MAKHDVPERRSRLRVAGAYAVPLLAAVALAGADASLALSRLTYALPDGEVSALAGRILLFWIAAGIALWVPLFLVVRWRRGRAPRPCSSVAALLAATTVAVVLRDHSPQPFPTHLWAWVGDAALCACAGGVLGFIGELRPGPWPGRLGLAGAAAALAWLQISSLPGDRPTPDVAWSPPAGAAPEDPPDLVLLTIDTWRADAVSYAHRPLTTDITPTLDGWALESLVYETAVAPAPLTGPSHSGMLSGTPPWRSGVITNGTPVPGDLPWVPALLRDRGYQTGAFVSSAMLAGSMGYARGFDVYDDDLTGQTAWHRSAWSRFTAPSARRNQRRESFERDGAETLTRAEHWLATVDPERPIFLWVHLYEPHAPYRPADEYRAHFADADLDLAHPDEYVNHPAPQMMMPDIMAPLAMFLEPADPRRKDQMTGRLRGQPATGREEDGSWRPPPQVWRSGRKYLGEVRTADAHASRLERSLLESRGGQEQRWVIAGDHGESLTEHHEFKSHKRHVYEANVRVPLLVRSGAPGATHSPPVSSVGVAGTLCALAGVSPPSMPCLPGTGEPCAGGAAVSPPASLVLGPDHAGMRRAMKVAVRDGDLKLVTALDRDGAETAWQEWYRLDLDPDEVEPLAPEVIPEPHREDLQAWAEAILRDATETRQGSPPEVAESVREALRALGYVD